MEIIGVALGGLVAPLFIWVLMTYIEPPIVNRVHRMRDGWLKRLLLWEIREGK